MKLAAFATPAAQSHRSACLDTRTAMYISWGTYSFRLRTGPARSRSDGEATVLPRRSGEQTGAIDSKDDLLLDEPAHESRSDVGSITCPSAVRSSSRDKNSW